MKKTLEVLDVVALERDVPEKGLRRGQVGTVVEGLGDGAFEVEFSDDNGRAYAFVALRAPDLLKLFYQPDTAIGA